jgi:hypothetical protein
MTILRLGSALAAFALVFAPSLSRADVPPGPPPSSSDGCGDKSIGDSCSNGDTKATCIDRCLELGLEAGVALSDGGLCRGTPVLVCEGPPPRGCAVSSSSAPMWGACVVALGFVLASAVRRRVRQGD